MSLLAGRSRSLGQQLGKHGYRRLIALPVAPEDVVSVQRDDCCTVLCVVFHGWVSVKPCPHWRIFGDYSRQCEQGFTWSDLLIRVAGINRL